MKKKPYLCAALCRHTCLYAYTREQGRTRKAENITSKKIQKDMTTKVFSLFNLNRRGSGVNLNLFRSVAMVLVLLTLGIGNAWAHSKHYGKATLVNATGHGTVYLSTKSDSNSGQTSSSNPGAKDGTSWITWNCGESESNDSKTYYARGTANNGYYYAGWATSSSATTYTAAATGKSFTATSTTEGSPNETKIYGFFKPVTIPSVATPSPNHFDATNTATTCLDYTGTVVQIFAYKVDRKSVV